MKQHFIEKMILAIHCETDEILNETAWKHVGTSFGWKNHVICDENKYKQEIIDTWKFLMNLWLVVGGTPTEFYQEFMTKHEINEKRITEEY